LEGDAEPNEIFRRRGEVVREEVVLGAADVREVVLSRGRIEDEPVWHDCLSISVLVLLR
jgi:hypothetical protein